MAPEVDEVAAEGLDVEAISDIREFCIEQRFSPVAPCRSIQAWLLRFI